MIWLLCLGSSMFFLGIVLATLAYWYDRQKLSRLEKPAMYMAIAGAGIVILWAILRQFLYEH